MIIRYLSIYRLQDANPNKSFLSIHTNDSFASWTVLASFIVYYNSQGSIGLRMSQFSRSNRFRCNFSLAGRTHWVVQSL